MTTRIIETSYAVACATVMATCTVSNAFAQVLPVPTPLVTVRLPKTTVAAQPVQEVQPVHAVQVTRPVLAARPVQPVQAKHALEQEPVIEASYEPFLPVQQVPVQQVPVQHVNVQRAAVQHAPVMVAPAPHVVKSAAAPMASADTQQVANDNWLLVAAGQVGGKNNSYSTVGVVAPLPGSSLGDGWVVRVFADELTYRFRDGADRKIDALGLGGSASVGYMDSDDNGWWGVYAGPAYRHVQLSPHDPGSEGAGGRISARLQAEGEHYVTEDMKLAGLVGTDISSNTGYWSRVRALQRVEGDIHAGPEAMLLGDEDYYAYQLGVAVTGVHLTDKAIVGVNGGYRKSENESGAAYGGLELGAEF